jgi:hypothetical protein
MLQLNESEAVEHCVAVMQTCSASGGLGYLHFFVVHAAVADVLPPVHRQQQQLANVVSYSVATSIYAYSIAFVKCCTACWLDSMSMCKPY